MVLKALDSSKHQLNIKDAFPLFDYKKIKALEWEYNYPNGCGEGFYLRAGEISLTGWTPNPMDSGAIHYPIEQFWGKLEEKVPNVFKKHLPEIKAALENALILE